MFLNRKNLFSSLLLISMCLVNVNPKKAFAQELNCKYGHWFNPNTGIKECFGENGTPIVTIRRRNSSSSSIGSSINDLGKSVIDMAKLCNDMDFLESEIECLSRLVTQIDNYSDTCIKASEFDNSVLNICQRNIEKIHKLLDD